MYTRKGDKRETSLYGQRRVGKDSTRVEAYGDVDELNSLLGVVASRCRSVKTASELREVQKLLFVAGADLAADKGSSPRVPRITKDHTALIERKTDALLRSLPPLRRFILPGGTTTAAELQLARAVCRRAERRVVTASRSEELNEELLPFFNRLSSYLFNMSRAANRGRGKEVEWSAE
jgi:cob(I)alamin adenosyltransferase